MVRKIPSIFNFEFTALANWSTVSINKVNPSRAKYSHCKGTKIESAAQRAFTVRIFKEGGQSINTKS